MSELMNAHDRAMGFRSCLLLNVSSLALLSCTLVANGAMAAQDDADRPTVWVQLGSQAERMDGVPEKFSAPFFSNVPPADLAPMIDTQRPSPYSIGGDGKLSFAPEGTNWVFSASIRYGHSSAARGQHNQTNAPGFHFTFSGQSHYDTHPYRVFGEGLTKFRESHAVIDFQAGKDVGLGLSGRGASSLLSAGVRIAQFTTDFQGTFHAQRYGMGAPMTAPGKYKNIHDKYRANYTAIANSARSVHVVGPSISWDASLPVAGDGSDVSLNIDWGLNAAVLFGRQQARVHHQTTGYSYRRTGGFFTGGIRADHYANPPPDRISSRSVTIPNVGGFAGISVRYADAKVSFGYRGDFFFNAMDTGFDTRKTKTIGFNGPFAAIAIGIGG